MGGGQSNKPGTPSHNDWTYIHSLPSRARDAMLSTHGLASNNANTRMQGPKHDQIPNNSDSKDLATRTRSEATDPLAKIKSSNENIETELPAVEFADQIEQLFPNIDPAFISMFPSVTTKEALIEYILQFPSYPKKSEWVTGSTPPKPGDGHNISGKYRNHRSYNAGIAYQNEAVRILEAEFPSISRQVFDQILQVNGTLHLSYVWLYKHLSMAVPNTQWKLSGRPNMKDGLAKELDLAKKEVSRIHGQHITRWAEEDTLSRTSTNPSPRSDETIECQCCYSDVLSSLTISCQSSKTHAFCHECIRKVANTQIGYMRYKIQCMHDSGCEATFLRSQLMAALGPQMLNKLESIQQENEIREAELDGLESCPFCDFKAIYPAVKDEPVFHCLKESCTKISCRSCRQGDHAPLTCREVQQKHGSRHRVEEAMSDVLIRRCPNPRCKVAIVKMDGCNQVRCTKCGRYMCFVCSKDISADSYNHFNVRNGCPTGGQVPSTQEHVRQVESTTIAQILRELPHLKEDDLRVDKPLPIRTEGTGVPPLDGPRPEPQLVPFMGGYYSTQDIQNIFFSHPSGRPLPFDAPRPEPQPGPIIWKYYSPKDIQNGFLSHPSGRLLPFDAPRPELQAQPQPIQNHVQLKTPGQQINQNNPLYFPPPPLQYQPDALRERRLGQGTLSPPAQRRPQNHPGARVLPTGENNSFFSRNPQPRPLAAAPRAQRGERTVRNGNLYVP